VQEAVWACHVCEKRGGLNYRITTFVDIWLERNHKEISPGCREKILKVKDIESLTAESLALIQRLELVKIA
jgi:hypothetical protein